MFDEKIVNLLTQFEIPESIVMDELSKNFESLSFSGVITNFYM